MDNLTKIYTKGVHEDLVFYYAQWLPNENIKIGVVGTLEGSFLSGKYLFRPLTTLSDLGIPFSPDDDILPDNDPASLDYKSKNGVKFISKVAGEATIVGLPNIPKGKAGIGYEFAKEGGYVLKAKEVYEPRIRDVISLQKRILKSYEQRH